MQNKATFLIAALVVATLMNASARGSFAAQHRPSVSNADRKWMMAAEDGQLKEISLGHLVVKRADNPAARRFAQLMISDHTKAQGELQRLARSKGVALPTHLGPKNRATLVHLQRLSPSRLSHDYIQNMVNDHYEDIADFRHEATHGRDKEVRAWARKNIPVLQMHLKMARATARGIVSTRKM